MKQKIKAILGRIVEIKAIKNTSMYVLNLLLPNVIFMKLKRWIAFIVYQDNVRFIKYNHTGKEITDNFRMVPCMNQKRKVDLVICCAFKGRHEILEKSIVESIFSKSNHHVEWFICGSTTEDFEFIQYMAAKTGKVSGMIWRNNPLGEKWNFCFKTAGDLYDSELYAISGSDDIISSTLIHNIITKHKKHQLALKTKSGNSKEYQLPAMYCTDTWIMIRTSSEDHFPSAIDCTLKQSSYYVPIGAGRFYSKEFLQQVEFNIFDISRNNCLDDYSYFKVKELGGLIERYQLDDGLLISVKGDWQQMNSIEHILGAESIEAQDYTFLMMDKFKEEISPEIFSYLFKAERTKETYAWSL